MKDSVTLSKSRLIAVFLALALVVAAMSFADQTNPGGAAKQLPGLGPDTIPDIVSSVSPAVVRIDTTVKNNAGNYFDPFFNDPFFRQFFGEQFRVPSQPRVSQGLGSGFIVSADGYILTNEHVISGADTIKVTLAGRNEPYPARKVGADHELDLAVLKIDAGEELPTIPLGDSDSTRVGDWVIAIGNPYGLDHTVTVGVISAKGRPITIEDRQYKNLLQTDASINPGNSGGPLLNLNGEVVGINTAIDAQAQGIGFAIPSSTVKPAFEQLVQHGSIEHPWLGVYLQPVTQEIARYYGVNDLSGALVAQVMENSPAAKAGLQRGDVIIRFDGAAVANPDELVDLVSNAKVGGKVEINFIRGGKTITGTVTIEAKKQ